jgi:integrase
MKLSIRFRLLPAAKSKPAAQSIYIRLAVNGVGTSDYITGVKALPLEWDAITHSVRGRSALAKSTNERLAAIKVEHLDIMNRLISLGKPVTAAAIKDEWTKGINPPPTILAAWQSHYDYLVSLNNTDMARKPGTLLKWRNGRTFLGMYIRQQLSRPDMEVDRLTVAWVRGWHSWLMTYKDSSEATRKAPQASDTAAKFISFLRIVLDSMVEARHISVNPIATLKIKRQKTKRITYLTAEQLLKLAALDLSGNYAQYRDLTLLCCYTGLDYPDLLRLLQEPEQYVDRATGLIDINRAKSNGRSLIPLLAEASRLIERYRGHQAPSYEPQTINRVQKLFASMVGFDQVLSLKICRKTTGTLFLNAGYDLESVSQILGHSSVKITQMHYAELLPKRIHQEMKRIGVNLLGLQSPDAATTTK